MVRAAVQDCTPGATAWLAAVADQGRAAARHLPPKLHRGERVRSVKQLTMYLWDGSGLTASGNHQVIAALEKLLFPAAR
jgi:hypothetical protein